MNGFCFVGAALNVLAGRCSGAWCLVICMLGSLGDFPIFILTGLGFAPC